MAAKKSSKTKKQVTEIDEAKVKIEVDEIEDKDKKEDEEEVEDKSEDETSEISADDAEDDSDDSDITEEENESWDEEKSSGRFSWKKVFLFTLVASLTGLLIVGGYLFVVGGYKISVEKQEQSEEKDLEIPDVTPTPTPAGVDREAYDIEVLNGSGIEGEAANVEELLEDEGFLVSEIGNADNAAYLDTQIYFLEDVDEDYLDELVEVLEERGPTDLDEAPEDQTEEVVVIVGSELADPDATPTPLLE